MENSGFIIKYTSKNVWEVYENGQSVAIITRGPLSYKFTSTSAFHPEIHSFDLKTMKDLFYRTQFVIYDTEIARNEMWEVYRPSTDYLFGAIKRTGNGFQYDGKQIQPEELDTLMYCFMSHHAPRDLAQESDEQDRGPSAEEH